LALTFVPVSLYIVNNHKNIWSYLVLSAMIVFLMILHATSAILVSLLLIPFVIIGFRYDKKHSLWTMLAVVVPFIVTLPVTHTLISSQASVLFTQKQLPSYISFIQIISGYGSLPAVFCLIGTFVLALKGSWKEFNLVVSLLVLLVVLAVYYTLHFGIDAISIRGILFAMLMMAMVAGAGFSEIRRLEFSWLDNVRINSPHVMKQVNVFLSIVVVGFTLVSIIPNRQAELYYHMIDETDYESFTWIYNNVDSAYSRAILDPWKATAFTALTEKYVYTRIHSFPKPKDEEAYQFLRNGSSNTSFLITNGISVIYTRVNDIDTNRTIEYEVNNPDLVEVKKYVYLLKKK
jgi:hypothetical protein